MTALRQRMIEAMQLRGLSPATQRAYVQALTAIARYFHTPPDCLTNDQLRQYFLYLRNEKQVARNTSTVALCALKFFYEYTGYKSSCIIQRTDSSVMVRPYKSVRLDRGK